ncbi:MAG: CoA-acylating methylmalonate-semialdehyde dehydrogenase [Chloroflexi bacterium]|nr:CoA-acylating methylmalonate-semialdehyde dehydrogenase [Chloroflexota bacterium]
METVIEQHAAEAVRSIQNFVGGQWSRSSAAESLPVTNPATGAVLAHVPLSNAHDVDVAVQAAYAAFPAWRATPPVERGRILFAVRDRMEAHFNELAHLVTEEHGKTLDDARGSVRRAIENVEVAAGIPSLMMGYGLEDGAARGIDEEVIRQPLGVFAAICPFNFPIMVPFWFWPYAIATGNTFIVKPSEQVPLAMACVFELLEDVGFPPGVLNLVHGSRETVEALIDHPLVRGVSFVGSTPVAKAVYARAAARGKRVQAQGGAKNVLVIMPDAVLDKTIANVIGSCFGSAGQRCLAGSLIITVGNVHERFVAALRDAAKALRVGNGLEEGTDVGPVISERARERISGAIARGVEEGAHLVLDGRENPAAGGCFLGPTIFEGVRPDMTVAREEIFGPVVGIVHVESLGEALAVIAASPYGNAASIFTQDGAAARTFRYYAPVGNVGINVGVAAPMAYFPFSGAKESFFGTLHAQGRDAIDFYCERKVVITRWF